MQPRGQGARARSAVRCRARGGGGAGEFVCPLRAAAEQPHAETTAGQLAEDAHRLARVGHGILEARRGGIGADLDDRIEHQDGPGAVVAGGGGELPTRADHYAHRREPERLAGDRKSTRLNSSHLVISYAVFCLKKKKKKMGTSKGLCWSVRPTSYERPYKGWV